MDLIQQRTKYSAVMYNHCRTEWPRSLYPTRAFCVGCCSHSTRQQDKYWQWQLTLRCIVNLSRAYMYHGYGFTCMGWLEAIRKLVIIKWMFFFKWSWLSGRRWCWNIKQNIKIIYDVDRWVRADRRHSQASTASD